MSNRTVAWIVAATSGALLFFWLAALPFARRSFRKNAGVAEPPHRPASPPGRWWIGAGSLWVFLVNIFTMGMFLAAAAIPAWNDFPGRLQIPLPGAVYGIGALLFVLDGVWGLLVLVFNPGYAPFFKKSGPRIFLATRGPYALVRHPRYASEAALNVILFLFTGCWVPLLGILAWPAIRLQAAREEEFLLAAAPEAYGRYRASTGRFLPRWKFRKEK